MFSSGISSTCIDRTMQMIRKCWYVLVRCGSMIIYPTFNPKATGIDCWRLIATTADSTKFSNMPKYDEWDNSTETRYLILIPRQ